MNRRIFQIFLGACLAGTQLPSAALAAETQRTPQSAGGLLVAPTRLVFDDRRRSAAISLINTGHETVTYRISFVQMRMEEDGRIAQVGGPEAQEHAADGLIRYSPRQVVLEPRVAQTVRLQVRKPPALAPGEYRSHLMFRALPAGEARRPEDSTGGLSVKLKVVYGVSIPVLVRHGEVSSRVKLAVSDPGRREPRDSGLLLNVRLEREGTASVYGNLVATLITSSGAEHVVGVMNGLAVYTPNRTRTVRMALRLPAGVTWGRGRLRVRYVHPERGEAPLATAEQALP